MKVRLSLIVGLSVIMVCFAFLIYKGIDNSATYYYTLAELKDPSLVGKQLRVKANLIKETVVYQAELSRLAFTVTDGEHQVKMIYDEVMPDNFNHITEVIVEGKMVDEHFIVSKLMLQCPSKYENESESNEGGE